MGHCNEPPWEALVQRTMPGHLSAEQIARYRGRRTPPEELVRVDDHISHCAECRERLASENELREALHGAASLPLLSHTRDLRTTALEDGSPDTHLQDASAAAPSGVPRDEHLAYEQLEAYVDGKMSDADRELARAHLEFCPPCSEDVRDLNTFKVELATSKGRAKGGWWALVAPWFTPRRAALALTMAALIVVAIEVGRWQLAPRHGVSPGGTANANSPGKETLGAISALTPEEQSAVLEAISHQKITSPEVLAELQGPGQTLLGGSTEGARFEVIEPLGEVVADVRPVFRWQPLAGATSYSVVIFDLNLNPVQSGPPLQATQWPADQPLRRGLIYLWQVTAKLSNGRTVSSPRPPSSEAKFRVLDQEKADELSRVQAAHGESHLALGILYAQAGILEQAEHELAQIPGSDPEYGLAQNLLKSIAEIRRPQP